MEKQEKEFFDCPTRRAERWREETAGSLAQDDRLLLFLVRQDKLVTEGPASF